MGVSQRILSWKGGPAMGEVMPSRSSLSVKEGGSRGWSSGKVGRVGRWIRLPPSLGGEDGSIASVVGLMTARGETDLLVPSGPKDGERVPSSNSLSVYKGW